MPSLFGSRNTAFMCMFSRFRAVFTKAGTSLQVLPRTSDRPAATWERTVIPSADRLVTTHHVPSLYAPVPAQAPTLWFSFPYSQSAHSKWEQPDSLPSTDSAPAASLLRCPARSEGGEQLAMFWRQRPCSVSHLPQAQNVSFLLLSCLLFFKWKMDAE